MYKQLKTLEGTIVENMVNRLADNATIPFDPANTDYQAFRQAILDSTSQLENADGTLMTADEAIAFVNTLQGVTL